MLIGIVTFASCSDDHEDYAGGEPEVIKTKLEGFRFLAKYNSKTLIADVECSIVGDSIIECLIPHIVDGKMLIPSFEVADGKLMADGVEVCSGKTVLDCTKPLSLQVKGGNYTKNYKLRVKSFTGLPVVYIDTEDKKEVASREEYVRAKLRIVEDIETRSAGEMLESTIRIKGRGNTTWTMPKKPYKIKFDKKTSLLGEPADKAWVLLANYADKTALRNETAFFMGRMSRLDYTSRTHFVELILNGVYNGTYQLGEQLKIASHRVNVGDDGFLMEVDARADGEDVTFKVNHINAPINIKDPELRVGDESYNYVVRYLQRIDSVLFSDSFRDAEKGYRAYLDEESFVDWYVINEIAKNNDACFFSSCYMNLERGKKLKMGPLWDFDIAFGNVNYNGCDNPEGFWIKAVAWYTRLFEDPHFVAKVKERFAYYYDHRNQIYDEINANAQYLKYSVVENNNKWGTLYEYTWPNNMIWGSYENEVQSFKLWLERRFQWLNEQFATMGS